MVAGSAITFLRMIEVAPLRAEVDCWSATRESHSGFPLNPALKRAI
jgi:hypothetical protein